MTKFRSLLRDDSEPPFAPIRPPFTRNTAAVRAYAPEVTGYRLLETLRRRLGWESYSDKRLFDLGCGVRFARTIRNLDLPFGHYIGVDVDEPMIKWLQHALREDKRFRFEHLKTANARYSPENPRLGADALRDFNIAPCNAACMFSVITHQAPEEARLTFAQLRCVTRDDGQLYFTGKVDASIAEYREGDSNRPGMLSTYPPEQLIEITEREGWRVKAVFHPLPRLQQTGFLCHAA